MKPGLFNKEFSKALMRAFEKRQVSDYEYTYTITHDEASFVIEDAERFLDAVAQYLRRSVSSLDHQ